MERATSEAASVRRACRSVAAVLVGGAWAALGYGLLFSPPDRRAWGDLEAGGRFAVNFAVYLPFYALTLVVLTAVLLGLLPTPDVIWPLVGTAVTVALFAWWVSDQPGLLDAQPWLWLTIWGCLLVNVCAALLLAWAWAAGRTR